MPEKKLDINVEVKEGAPAVVALVGELDHSNFDRLETVLFQLFEDKKVSSIEFEFKNLEYISSAGVGVLISAISQAQSNNGTVKFKNLSLRVREIFTILGLPKEYFEQN
jgi:anti-sigma B factor antagonist